MKIQELLVSSAALCLLCACRCDQPPPTCDPPSFPPFASECPDAQWVVVFPSGSSCPDSDGLWSVTALTDNDGARNYCIYQWAGMGQAPAEPLLPFIGTAEAWARDCEVTPKATIEEFEDAARDEFRFSIRALPLGFELLAPSSTPASRVELDIIDTAPAKYLGNARSSHGNFLTSLAIEIAGATLLQGEAPCTDTICVRPRLGLPLTEASPVPISDSDRGGFYGRISTIIPPLNDLLTQAKLDRDDGDPSNDVARFAVLAFGWSLDEDKSTAKHPVELILEDLSALDVVSIAAAGNVGNGDEIGPTAPASFASVWQGPDPGQCPDLPDPSLLLFPISAVDTHFRRLSISRPESDASFAACGQGGTASGFFNNRAIDGPFSGTSVSTGIIASVAAILKAYGPPSTDPCEVMEWMWKLSKPAPGYNGSSPSQTNIGPFTGGQKLVTVCDVLVSACDDPDFGPMTSLNCSQIVDLCSIAVEVEVEPASSKAQCVLCSLPDRECRLTDLSCAPEELAETEFELVIPQPDRTMCPICSIEEGMLHLIGEGVTDDLEELRVTLWYIDQTSPLTVNLGTFDDSCLDMQNNAKDMDITIPNDSLQLRQGRLYSATLDAFHNDGNSKWTTRDELNIISSLCPNPES